MSSRRVPPMIVLAVGAIMSVVAFGRSATPESLVGDVDPISAATVGASSADAFGSTWFCAGGSVDVDGTTEHAIVIVNPGASDSAGSLTVFGVDGVLTARSISIASHSRSLYRLGGLVGESVGHAAVMVEFDTGAMVVSHRVTGPTGADHGRCASGASTSWQFASGVTQQDASLKLVLFNPFPETASVDVVFDAEDGHRAPQAFEGLVVPAESIRVLDVGAEVPLREALATRVAVRSGRIIADRIQSFDGTAERSSLGLELGATGQAVAWAFPGGRIGQGESVDQLIIANVADAPAEIEVEFIVDEAFEAPDIVTRTVFPGSREVVDVDPENRLEAGTPFVAVVHSYNGVPILAEQVLAGTQQVSVLGDTVMASRYVLPSVGERITASDGQTAGDGGTNPSMNIVVFNPAETKTNVAIGSVFGEVKPVGSFEVEPGSLGVYSLPDDGGDAVGALLVEADHPVLLGVAGLPVPGPAVPLDDLTAITADF